MNYKQVAEIETYNSTRRHLTDVDVVGILRGSTQEVLDSSMLGKLVASPKFEGTVFRDNAGLLRSYMELRLKGWRCWKREQFFISRSSSLE